MLTTALSLPTSQYYCVTMAAISGIHPKLAYSSKLQHRSLVKVQPSGSQTFMSRGPLLSLTGDYLIYRDTWINYVISQQSYLVKASARGPQRTTLWPPRWAEGMFQKPWFSRHSCSWAFLTSCQSYLESCTAVKL